VFFGAKADLDSIISKEAELIISELEIDEIEKGKVPNSVPVP
jgi:hypothetical protein